MRNLSKLFLVVFAMELLPVILLAQWTHITTPSYDPGGFSCSWNYKRSIGSHNKIYFAYSANCAAGSMGQYSEYEIFSSVNAGTSWNSEIYLGSENLGIHALEFISADTGYMVIGPHNHSTVYRTADGLSTYQECWAAGDFHARDQVMLSYDDMYLVDTDARIWHLENDTFQLVYTLPVVLPIIDKPVLMADQGQRLFIACADKPEGTYKNDLILRSLDGGLSWDTAYLSENVRLNDIKFATENLGIAIGDDGIILKTQDGGDSWEEIPAGTGESLYSIDFRDPSTWLIGASGTLLISFDAGDSWSLKYGPNQLGGSNVDFPEKDNIVYVGYSSIWKSDIDYLTCVNKQGKQSGQILVSPNPASGSFSILFPGCFQGTSTLEILDTSGKVIKKQMLTGNRTEVKCASLQPGLYLVHVSLPDGQYFEKLLIH